MQQVWQGYSYLLNVRLLRDNFVAEGSFTNLAAVATLRSSIVFQANVMGKKKTEVSINFIVFLHVYPFDVMVSIGQTDLELGKCLDKYSLQVEDDECLPIYK